jgi:hypothetical protein
MHTASLTIVAAAVCIAPACSRGAAGAGDVDARADVECGVAETTTTLPYDDGSALVGCARMLGSVHVPDAVSADVLVPLRSVRRIDGRLTLFRNHALPDLSDLARLEHVGGRFSIRLDDSDGLFTSVDGVDALREVGELELIGNPDLRTLRGLGRLEAVHGDLSIVDNPSLPPAEIDALLDRLTVGGSVQVDGNGI